MAIKHRGKRNSDGVRLAPNDLARLALTADQIVRTLGRESIRRTQRKLGMHNALLRVNRSLVGMRLNRIAHLVAACIGKHQLVLARQYLALGGFFLDQVDREERVGHSTSLT